MTTQHLAAAVKFVSLDTRVNPAELTERGKPEGYMVARFQIEAMGSRFEIPVHMKRSGDTSLDGAVGEAFKRLHRLLHQAAGATARYDTPPKAADR